MNTNGEVRWTKVFPFEFPGQYSIKNIQRTSDKGFIVAAHTGYIYRSSGIKIMKLNDQGEVVWGSVTPVPSEGFYLVYTIRQTKDGGYIFGGFSQPFEPARPSFIKSADQSSGMLIGKLGGHGKQQWLKKYNVASATSIVQSADGSFLIATSGGSLLRLNSQGNVVWQKKFTDAWLYVANTSDSGSILISNTNATGVVIKLNSNAETVWQKRYSGGREQNFRIIAQASDGGYIVSGSSGTFSQHRALAIKLTSDGEIVWQKNYGPPGTNHFATAISATKDGGYVLGTKNGWLLKLDSTGNIPNICANLIRKYIDSLSTA